MSQTSPVGFELFWFLNAFFCSNWLTQLLVTWLKQVYILIDRFHSRGLQLCKFLVTKEKLFNIYRTHVVNQHGRRFIVFLHKYGRRDVMWKRSLVERRFNKLLCNEILGITSDFLQPSNGEIYGKNLNVTKPCYSEHIVRVPLAIPQGILSVEIFQ